MKIFTLFVSAIGVVMSLAYYPQAYKIWKRKSAENISILSYLIFGIGTLSWFLYGVLINDLTIIWGFVFGVVGSWLVLFLTLRYRRKDEGDNHPDLKIEIKKK